MLRSARNRCEALNRRTREAPEINAALPNPRRVDQRIAHGNPRLWRINNATVWQTVQEDRPALREVIQGLLAELGIILRSGYADQLP
jgi:hypothetical protein